MDRIELMSVVVSVAEAGSLSAAARMLRMPVPTVSRKLSELEAHLKTQLFQRSSRRMSLTEAGRSYLEACKRIISRSMRLKKRLWRVSRSDRRSHGDVAVGSSGHLHLVPLSCEFLNTYPDIALRLLLTDRVLNPVDNKIDAAIRIGPLPDSSMIATRIGSIRVVACASPEYLAAHERLQTPKDLCNHDCITIDETIVPRSWKFMEGRKRDRRANSNTADGEHLGGRSRSGDCGRRDCARHVLQDGGCEANRPPRYRLGLFRKRTIAGPYRLH